MENSASLLFIAMLSDGRAGSFLGRTGSETVKDGRRILPTGREGPFAVIDGRGQPDGQGQATDNVQI